MHEDSPEDVVHDVFTEALWPEPPARPADPGHRRDDRATRPARRVQRFYRRHYVPGHLVVAAAGNVRHDDLVRMLERPDGHRAATLGPNDTSPWNLRAPGTAPAAVGHAT